MTPNPNSPMFIKNEVPENAHEEAKILAQMFSFIKNKARENDWYGISEDNILLEYNVQTQYLEIEVRYKDKLGILHRFFIEHYRSDWGFMRSTSVFCKYLWECEGENIFDTGTRFVRSFAELIMVFLWEDGIDAELNTCDRGLSMEATIGSVYSVFCKLLRTVVLNIPSKEWYLKQEPIWPFRETYSIISKLIHQLKEEAKKKRWKEIMGSNFYIMRDIDYAYLCLDYVKANEFEQRIKIGLDMDSLVDFEKFDKQIECSYEFSIVTKDPERRAYFEKGNQLFINHINNIFTEIFTSDILYVSTKDYFKMTVYKDVAFQKICLLLDIFVPIKDAYIGPNPFDYLSKLRGSGVIRDDCECRLFAGGEYRRVSEMRKNVTHIDTSFREREVNNGNNEVNIPF